MNLVKLVLGIKDIPNALKKIREYCKNNPEELNRHVDGMTALMLACQNSNGKSSIECVELLMELGAKVNFGPQVYSSALTEACKHSATTSSLVCVKLLIAAGADVNFKRCLGKSVLIDTVCRYNISSSIECLSVLIDSGADTKVRTHKDFDALIYAIRKYDESRSLDCISLLIKYCNINSRSTRVHFTPLMIARTPECIDFLIKSGADINLHDAHGNTALMRLCMIWRAKYTDCIKILINSGADVNIKNKWGSSALMIVCTLETPYIECLYELVCAGVELDSVRKLSVLKIVCENCIDELSETSIACINYAVNYENTHHQTALMALCQQCHFNERNMCVLIDLINVTDNILAKDSHNKTAFDYYESNVTHYNDEYVEGLLTGKVVPTKSARRV